MKFSQRIGKTPATKSIQLESLDDDLKNGLWNIIKFIFLDRISRSKIQGYPSKFNIFCEYLWHEYYKLSIDDISYDDYYTEKFIKDKFYKGPWYESYNLIEFLASTDTSSFGINSDNFTNHCNIVLEKEFSGYRFIGYTLSPITNQHEIEEIEISIDNSSQFTTLRGANIHLKLALEKLSDRKNPDYRNSIKESISAVESVSKVISGNTKDSLGAAIDKIKGKIAIHPALEKGLKNLYGYTSDGDGIRHALMDASNCDFEDAKFMLVSCSAFINYLIVKADKAGITLNSKEIG